MKVFDLGKRLQVFIKDVLPKHIDYYNAFNGQERMNEICVKVDEYLKSLRDNLEMGSAFSSSSAHYDNYEEFFSDDDCLTFMNGKDFTFAGNVVDSRGKSKDSISIRDLTFNTVGKGDESNSTHVQCDSSASTSYTTNANEVDWDDCEFNGEVVGNGFIVTGWNEAQNNFDDQDFWRGETVEWNLVDSQEVTDDSKDTNNKQTYHKLSHRSDVTDDFRFKSLISHWKEQERKWEAEVTEELTS
jgi:hypothetical protein